MGSTSLPHPLSALSIDETNLARDVVRQQHSEVVLDFRQIFLQEPPKAEVLSFLEAEHSDNLSESTPRPARLALVTYDVIGGSRVPEYHESIVDLTKKERVKHQVVSSDHHASLTVHEFERLVQVIKDSPLFQEKVKELQLPQGFDVVIEPWPYGAPDVIDGKKRFFQGLVFAHDKRSGNEDSNFYAFPLPLIPVMDAHTHQIVRIDELATGGKGDALTGKTHKADILEHSAPCEYVPELLPEGVRRDLKPLSVIQPDGASFTVADGNLIRWQKWSMRMTFNSREGAVLHDIRYDGRSIMYRLSMSDMVRTHCTPTFPDCPMTDEPAIRLYLTQTPDRHSIESKRLTSETVVLGMLLIISLWDVIAWALSRWARSGIAWLL